MDAASKSTRVSRNGGMVKCVTSECKLDCDYPTYLVLSVLISLAIVSYLLFILFTFSSKALLRPKNIFKSNFATSAIIYLVSIKEFD